MKKFLNVFFIIIIAAFFIIAILIVKKENETKFENVFDLLYYQVEMVKKGNKNVLLNGTESAYADYDFGSFENIQIPEIGVVLSIGDDSLHILFSNRQEGVEWNTSHIIHYKYLLSEKKIYGERSFDYLMENFISHYFKWCENDNLTCEYSPDNLGNYSFEMMENVYY